MCCTLCAQQVGRARSLLIECNSDAGSDGGLQRPDNSHAVQTSAGNKKAKAGKKASKAVTAGLNGQPEDPPVEFLVAKAEDEDEHRTVMQGLTCQ